MQEVKECPFCGSEAGLKQDFVFADGDPFYVMECRNCHVRGVPGLTEDGAAELWNARDAASMETARETHEYKFKYSEEWR